MSGGAARRPHRGPRSSPRRPASVRPTATARRRSPATPTARRSAHRFAVTAEAHEGLLGGSSRVRGRRGTAALVGCYQFVLAGLHPSAAVPRGSPSVYPNVAIVVPAWNEAPVIVRTLDRSHRPRVPGETGCASTSSTTRAPTRRRAIVLAQGGGASRQGLSPSTPAAVARARRRRSTTAFGGDPGGGLLCGRVGDRRRRIFQVRDALRMMTRRLADPAVGAVTPLHQGGQLAPANYLNNFVPLEYITAQAAARRAQNVLGAQACLAGGSQLLTPRPRWSALGGRIDTENARRGHGHDVQDAAQRPPRRCSSPTRSSRRRSRASSRGCGSSACAGAKATSR